jgi:hypothetical protein
MKAKNFSNYEPDPVRTNETPVWELVVQDMQQRDNQGRQKYGTPLQASNGRDALVDLYQELLDACVYIRQEIERRSSVSSSSLAENHCEACKNKSA